jgi:transcriptional regulator with XRE-family HTH domain
MKINTEKIKDELRRLGITQAELARTLGESRQALHYQVKSGRSFPIIERIAKALNIPERDLIA